MHTGVFILHFPSVEGRIHLSLRAGAGLHTRSTPRPWYESSPVGALWTGPSPSHHSISRRQHAIYRLLGLNLSNCADLCACACRHRGIHLDVVVLACLGTFACAHTHGDRTLALAHHFCGDQSLWLSPRSKMSRANAACHNPPYCQTFNSPLAPSYAALSVACCLLSSLACALQALIGAPMGAPAPISAPAPASAPAGASAPAPASSLAALSSATNEGAC